MRRIGSCAIALLVLLSVAVPANAEWLSTFFRHMERDALRNNCWPQPFVVPDRAAVYRPMAIQVAKGWKAQTTVSDHHFEAEGAQLNQAGRLKVQWIVNNVPPRYRTVYVQQGPNREATAGRLDEVQQIVVQLIPQGELPGVLASHSGSHSHPAEYVDKVYRMFNESTPSPRLPQSANTSAIDTN